MTSKKIRPGRYPVGAFGEHTFWWRSQHTGKPFFVYRWYQDAKLTFSEPYGDITAPATGYPNVHEAVITVYLGVGTPAEFRAKYVAWRLAAQARIFTEHKDLIAMEWVEPPFRHYRGNLP